MFDQNSYVSLDTNLMNDWCDGRVETESKGREEKLVEYDQDDVVHHEGTLGILQNLLNRVVVRSKQYTPMPIK